jgi:MFS family permease
MPLLPRYATEHGADGWLRGLLFACFSGMQFLFAPFWGRLSDRIGRRPILLVGLGGSVASYLLFAIAELTPIALPLLFVSRIAAGIFGATISTASATIADLTTPEQRGRGMALIGIAFGVGFTLGPVIGGLGHSLHPCAPGLIASGCSLLAFLYGLKNLPEPGEHKPAAAGRWLGAPGLRAALRTPSVPRILLLAVLSTAAFAMFESTLSVFTQKRMGLDVRENGWIFAYIGICLMLAQGMLVRRLMPRLREVRIARAGAVLLCGGLLLLWWVDTVGLLYAVVPVIVLGFACLTPSLSSLVSLRTPGETQGEVLGIYQSGLSLARIVGPVAGNRLQDVGAPFPYLVGACALVLAIGLAFSVREVRAAAATA